MSPRGWDSDRGVLRCAAVVPERYKPSGWMMMAMSADGLPDINFARIRPYGQPASRAHAFEELASILIEQGAVGGLRQ